MIRHILFLSVNTTYNSVHDVLTCFQKKFDLLKVVLPEIKSAEIKENLDSTSHYQICLNTVFDNETDLNYYINHPEHLKIREYLISVCSDKIAFDYKY